MAKSKEQTSDFPVAFVTNLLYLISINDLKDQLLPEIEEYLKIIIQKQDFMHLEGIGQCASALNNFGIYNEDVWLALD